jgi:DNA-binding response OmpR family regulator
MKRIYDMAKKILIVDDDPDILVIATVRLKYMGYEIISVVDAENALIVLKTEIPDLIILDRLLPKMQGEDLCKKLKSDDKYKNIPIILFTALVDDVAKVVKEIGADDYITKPFEPKDLISKVQTYAGDP